MNHTDLAKKDHWDNIYENAAGPGSSGWKPSNYDALALEYALMNQIERYKPGSLLEIGCGNSVWLPYLARKTGAIVAGIDYSEAGCRLARQRLALEGIEGKVFCLDLFKASPEDIGQYDFVFSLGVVEHFTDLEGVIFKLTRFVKPGGILFTEVPNLWISSTAWSLHGLLSWIWQPELLAKHAKVTKSRLLDAYESAGMKDIRAVFLGIFSLNIVAWELYPRWPILARLGTPFIRRAVYAVDLVLHRVRKFSGVAPLAPFIYVIGQKSDQN